jgi:Bifunctional DNA primase/polymerase, N-terminal/CHC2 zinc finger
MATTRFDHSRLPDAVGYFEKIFGRRLRFNGAGWAQVSCPFHPHDSTPSLSLHRDGGFNCFACGAHGGDIIEFEHLRTGRDRRAIAESLGAWSGRPIVERERPAWARPAPRPIIVKDRAEQPKLTAEYLEAVRLNFRRIKDAAHVLCDKGFSVHPLYVKRPGDSGWPDAPRKTHDDIEREFRPRPFGIVTLYPNLGFRIDLEPVGSAPNVVTDVDIRTDNPAEIAECMAAVRRHMGDRRPDTVTGRGGLHFYDQLPRAQIERIFGTRPDGSLATSAFKLDWLGAAEGALPPRDGTGWTIEMLAPRHSVTVPPSIHLETLKPYRGA